MIFTFQIALRTGGRGTLDVRDFSNLEAAQGHARMLSRKHQFSEVHISLAAQTLGSITAPAPRALA